MNTTLTGHFIIRNEWSTGYLEIVGLEFPVIYCTKILNKLTKVRHLIGSVSYKIRHVTPSQVINKCVHQQVNPIWKITISYGKQCVGIYKSTLSWYMYVFLHSLSILKTNLNI